MRESHRSSASCTPSTGDMPATKVHALDRNRTQDPSVPKPTLYPLSQTGLGIMPQSFVSIGYAYMLAYESFDCSLISPKSPYLPRYNLTVCLLLYCLYIYLLVHKFIILFIIHKWVRSCGVSLLKTGLFH